MSVAVNVNGFITDQHGAAISVFDHGFLYGEGVYETLRTYDGRPFLLDRHLRRLRQSAAMIALECPLSDSELGDRLQATMAHAADAQGAGAEWYLRLLLTRGIGDLTYDPAATPVPSLVIIVKPHVGPPQAIYTSGIRVVMSSIVRNHPGTVNPLIKSNNLMNNVLAMQEGLKQGAFEVVMRNYRGELTECAMSNLFIVKGGSVLTPPVDAGLLPGITREVVLEIGQRLAVPVKESTLWDDDLYGADEAFLTGTTREILGIVRVEDRQIGTGMPGPVTRRLLMAFREFAHSR